MINGKQFGRRFAEQYGVTYQDAEQICKHVFELLGLLLYDEKQSVVIHRFGSFKRKTAKSKRIRHPGTGELITTPERDFVKFTASELLDEKEE